MSAGIADVCVIVEGTYPHVVGGVSQWVQQLIEAQPDLRFHLVSIMPPGKHAVRYKVPANVIRHTAVRLPTLPDGKADAAAYRRFVHALAKPLLDLQRGQGLTPIEQILQVLAAGQGTIDSHALLNSRAAWDLLKTIYLKTHRLTPFLSYFWGWRTLLAGLFTMLTIELPRARVYHPICTGYAGLLAARAYIETGRPVMLTEHGIYTNERRIEIALADWIEEPAEQMLSLEGKSAGIRDLWVDWFVGYSRACYECCSEIITLYEGNQSAQKLDGAPPDRLRVIPNGIDCSEVDEFSPRRRAGRPTVALIGRVVPIKDVKTLLRACASLRARMPGLRALVLGPTEEDPVYYRQCLDLVEHLKLQDTVEFTGRVKLAEYFGQIDVLVLTSISEAQPLVILEAGAHGIPVVATNVGGCAEMIHGRSDERPNLGTAGVVTPLANPLATAEALCRLLTDEDFYQRCSRTIRQRIVRYYNKTNLDHAYWELYDRLRTAPRSRGTAGQAPPRVARTDGEALWPA
ncbi:MAG: GT4 family glycosyltransferase PelF [Bryobacterales bacterium]|nr:GT4 family glycosyltransferase PelF [Bryobacterales bacterium]